MYASRSTRKSGFTLVEILIVVIILGILAAIVIPQFTNASTEARENSTRSLLQTIRSQVELYKLQHGDRWPTDDGTATGPWNWTKLTAKTNEDGSTTGTPVLGPYLQSTPVNSHRNQSGVQVVANDAAAISATAGAAEGWVFSSATGKIFAFESSTDTDADSIFNE